MNSLNIVKLETFLKAFKQELDRRSTFTLDQEELKCNIVDVDVNTANECGTPGCHAGWLYLVLKTYCQELVDFLKIRRTTGYSYREYDYEFISLWFIHWLTDTPYTFEDIVHKKRQNSLGHLVREHISTGLWGNKHVGCMFTDKEAFDSSKIIFPAKNILDRWENVLRKIKNRSAMIDVLRESGYIPSNINTTNDDLIYSNFEDAIRVHHMMDASNLTPVAHEFIGLRYKYQTEKCDPFHHPLVHIAFDKMSQLYGKFNCSDITFDMYSRAQDMYDIAISDPYDDSIVAPVPSIS